MKVLIKEKLSPHKSKTPEGYLICRDAILARTGTQEYYASEIYPDWQGEDKEIKVMRKPEQVFSDETIASFENKPITCEHPDEDVTPENYKDYSVGFVRDVHRATVNGEDVMVGNLIITDSDIINDIENDIRTELSCGYNCDITDGDQPEQINIRGNHIALCERGRAGIAKIIDSAATRDAVVARYNDPETAPWVKVSKGKFHEITGTWPKSDIDLIGTVSVETEKAYLVYLHPAQEFIHTGYGWQRTSDKEGWVPKSLATPIDPAEYFAKSNVEDAKAQKYIPGDTGFLKQIENIAFNAKSMMDEVKDKELMLEHIWARLHTLVNNLSNKKKEIGTDMAKAIIIKLGKEYDLDVNQFTNFNDAESEPALSKADRAMIAKILAKISGYTTNDRTIEDIIEILKSQTGFDFIRESIDGWYKVDDGTMRKDYIFKPEGYRNRFLISLYAPHDYIVNEVNAYFTDAICDKLIQSSSKKALKKNIETEIKAGKDPKQAAAIAYSVQRANDAHYDIRPAKGHYEIYKNNKLWATADSRQEAVEMIREDEAGDLIDDDFRGEIIDTEDYRGYDIEKEGGKYKVYFEDKYMFFDTCEDAKKFVDEKLELTQNMIRDYKIRQKTRDDAADYSDKFKEELEKLISENIERTKEESSDDEFSKDKFKKQKRNLLELLIEQRKAVRNDK